ncbi:MAG: polyhydroxyalkanoate synthesis regulator DNA-binding domain-containing protein [Solirubrobacteraceae bacterium]
MARAEDLSGTGAKRVIKRYPNRKLYDSVERSFTSLRGVERMIRRGIDVQVIDNASGEDITEDTLAQVLRSARRGDIDVLSSMIRTPGKIARTIAGEEDNAAEIRELRETVRRLSETIDKLVADKDGERSKSEDEAEPGGQADGS